MIRSARIYTKTALSIWTLVAVLLVLWQVQGHNEEMKLLATSEARASWRKDVLYRSWATGHGGVYVPPTEKTPPDPYLSLIPERDVVTTSGKRLTLINPEYMTRQVFESDRDRFGNIGRITSLRPINPSNAPDQWERAALAAFDRGEAEASSVESLDGKPYMRLMRPLAVEEGCLKCHAVHGDKVGDIRGGISVAIPMEPFYILRGVSVRNDFLAVGLLWIIGIALILAGGRRLESDIRKLGDSERDIRDQLVFREEIVEFAADGISVCHSIIDPPYVEFTVWNRRMTEITGYSMEDINLLGWYQSVYPDPDVQARAVARMERMRQGENLRAEEWEITRSDGTRRHLRISTSVLQENSEVVNVLAVMHDVTDQKHAEAEKEKLQLQLQQAMKMEAVGRLAGGVAHDFNNLLTAILGNLSLAGIKLSPSDPVAEMISEANKAAERATLLTKQLLAFSRKQIIEPKVVDLNGLVAGLEIMLSRLIGENIVLRTVLGKDLWAVKVDTGQFEQILVNLAVNSRDAMPDGGDLVIETSNVEFDESCCARHPDSHPGDLVLLAVSDTGHGMTEEIKAHIFEPFFTTKEKGKGTGLGLASTYGVVKQSGGMIEVCSEVGKGTTLKIYLPRVDGEIPAREKYDGPQDLLKGDETVLVVEDEDVVRNLCVTVLEKLGYRVLSASNGKDAIAVAREHGAPIGLLLTDVMMPGMNGAELATQLVLMYPDMKVLFTSGYTDDTIVHRGVLDDGVSFIAKPYSLSGLSKKIREVLEGA